MSKQFTLQEKLYNYRYSLLQSEILSPVISELVQDIPDVLSSPEQMINAISDKLDVSISQSSEQQKEILATVKKEVVDKFQSILKLRLRNWLDRKHYVRKILAVVLIPSDEEFDETKVEEREKSFGALDLENEDDVRTVDEVIDYFFTKIGVCTHATPTSLSPAAEKSSR